MFAPSDARRPAPEPTLTGKLILATVVGFDPSGPAQGVTAPPPGPTAEYGRYLTESVVDCWSCHTAGFSPSKLRGKHAYAGGFELVMPDGTPVRTPNITPDVATGIGGWTRAEFVRAMRDGVRPDGTMLRPPMPTYRALSEVELTAIWEHLRTVPAVANAIPRAKGPAVEGEDPLALFLKHACAACHGEGMPFRAKLRGALAHEVDEVAARILRPQAFAADATMPSYEGQLDEATARRLAAWVREEAGRVPEANVVPAGVPAGR